MIGAEEEAEEEEEKDDEEGDEEEEEKPHTGPVFSGMTFCLSGTLSMGRKEMEALIKKNGGKTAASVTKSVTHLLTTENEFENETSKVTKAKELGLPLVGENFIHESITAKKPLPADQFSLDEEVREAFEEKRGKKRKRGEDDDDEDGDGDDEEGEEVEGNESMDRPTKRIKLSWERAPTGRYSGTVTEHLYGFNVVPQDVLSIIFSFLEPRSLFGVMCACKTFHGAVDTEEFWLHYYNAIIVSPKLAEIKPSEELLKNEPAVPFEANRYGREENNFAKRLLATSIVKNARKHVMTLERFKIFADLRSKAVAASSTKFTVPALTTKSLTREAYYRILLSGDQLRQVKASTASNDGEFSGDIFKSLSKAASKKDAEKFVVGAWTGVEDASEESAAPVVKWIVDNKDKLQHIKSLYLCDIPPDYTEISWINLCDISGIFQSLPNLLSYTGKGSIDLAIQPFASNKLMRISLIKGGLPASVIKSIFDCDLPSLVHLELYLGTNNYGGDYKPETFEKFLSPTEHGIFPSLHRLGLMNMDKCDALYGMIVKSAIAKRVLTIDLSLGTLDKRGAEELFQLKNFPLLEDLELNYNYLSGEMMERLVDELDCCVSLLDPQGNAHENQNNQWDDRYCSISE